MELLGKIRNGIMDYYKDEKVTIEKKVFYLVMSCSISILLILGIIFYVTKSEQVMGNYCLIIAVYVGVTTAVASITGRQLLFSWYYCILMNFFFTPIMFFMSQGVYYGMVLFLILGALLTVFLLGRQKYSIILVVSEIIYDIGLIIYVYRHSDKVYLVGTEISQEKSIAIATFMVCIALIFLFAYHNFIFDEMRKSVFRDNMSIERAENTKGRFLANITHEIRTPMNAIIGLTNLILNEDLSKTSRENVAIIKNVSGQLLQVINNILEYSKLDSGRAELIENEYSFRNMISEIIENVSYEYSFDGIDIHVFVSKNIPDKLFGDEIRIKQVLRYILFSSISRTPYGSVYFDIDGEYDEIESIVDFKIRIASSGQGFAKDELEVIFNAYSNYDSRQRIDYNKTGLELAICQKMLRMMNGDVTIDSIEGIGTAVNLSFSNYVIDSKPIVTYDNNAKIDLLIYLSEKREEYAWKRLTEELSIPAGYVRSPLSFRNAMEKHKYSAIFVPDFAYNDVKEYIEAFECQESVFVITDLTHSIGDFGACKILRHPIYLFNFIESINGKYDESKYTGAVETKEIIYPYARVLCVDDSNVNLIIFKNMLSEFDINPTVALSGKEALEILQNNEFDILFIDQKMPEMDGFELLSEIKKLRNGNRVASSVLATADFGNDLLKKVETAGFNDYLAKPISHIYLSKILNKYLPEEFQVRKTLDLKTKKNKKHSGNDNNTEEVKKQDKAIEIDPTEFNPEIGIANLGGSKEAYISVLMAYYEEGKSKLIDVPKAYADGDISLYTTFVHALKSSSASVGAMGISPMFKKLEFAGKDNNMQVINENSEKTLELFEKVLTKVEEYLKAEDAFTVSDENEFEGVEVTEINKDLLKELADCILAMNLRRSEEIINELSENNYGSDINAKIKEIRNSYDNFEYMEIKKIVGELL